MNWTAKYVVFDSTDCIVFSETINHKAMSNAGRGKVVGAGKCYFKTNTAYLGPNNGYVDVSCHGKSDSLGVESRGSIDEQIIGRFMLQYDLR